MADFFDWWNLDNLTQEDYTSYVNQKGQKMMTLAERAFIANSKALLKLNVARLGLSVVHGVLFHAHECGVWIGLRH